MVWTVDQTTTDQMADDWNSVTLGRKYVKNDFLTLFGNSITESSFNYGLWFTNGSEGSLIYYDNQGVGGDTTQDMLDRISSIKDGTTICTVMEAVNDAGNSVTPEQHAINIKEIIQTLSSRGIRVVFLSSPPANDVSRANNIEEMNFYDWVTCSRLGVEYYSCWDIFTDASTAGWKAGASSDGIHPENITQQQAGLILSDKFFNSPSLPQTRSNTNGAGLLPNSCFIEDSNGDGTPDGYTTYGGGTRTLIQSDVGNKFTLSDTGTSNVYVADNSGGARALLEGGKEYIFTCISSAVISGSDSSVTMSLRTPDGGAYPIREATESYNERLIAFSINPTVSGEFGVTLQINGSDHDSSISIERADIFCITDYDIG